jgi:hypothetical protein
MPRRITATYLHLVHECLDMAGRANPFERERLVSIAEMWLKLAAEELDEVDREARRERARSDHLQAIQHE